MIEGPCPKFNLKTLKPNSPSTPRCTAVSGFANDIHNMRAVSRILANSCCRKRGSLSNSIVRSGDDYSYLSRLDLLVKQDMNNSVGYMAGLDVLKQSPYPGGHPPNHAKHTARAPVRRSDSGCCGRKAQHTVGIAKQDLEEALLALQVGSAGWPWSHRWRSSRCG